MEKITVDGVTYELSALTAAARQQIANVQATDAEIQRLQSKLAMLATARAAYAEVLKAELPPSLQ